MYQAQVLLVSISLLVAVTSAFKIPLNNPVRSAAEDEVKNLPGLEEAIKFKHYSGYLNADEEQNRFWHYWLVESERDPEKDPLLLWLNGGPGCSSLWGLLTELGPFSLTENNSLVINPMAWNKLANVIFLESPVEVGFSYAADGDNAASDDSTAQQNYKALKSFMGKFPQYKDRPFYITGESYAGVFLPTLALLLDEDREINFKGMAIGNGYLDVQKLSESVLYFAYFHGFVGDFTWNNFENSCCDGNGAMLGKCHVSDQDRTDKCSLAISRLQRESTENNINPYNVYHKGHGFCSSDLLTLHARRELFDRELKVRSFIEMMYPGNATHRELILQKRFNDLESELACGDKVTDNFYLDFKEVRDALHIPEQFEKQFQVCSTNLAYQEQYAFRVGGMTPQINKLIDSKRNLTLLIYNGDVDTVCDFMGDEWFVENLGRKVIQNYQPWYLDKQVAGFAKYFDGITFMTIRGSGHMVPGDRPAEALKMLSMFLEGMKPEDARL